MATTVTVVGVLAVATVVTTVVEMEVRGDLAAAVRVGGDLEAVEMVMAPKGVDLVAVGWGEEGWVGVGTEGVATEAMVEVEMEVEAMGVGAMEVVRGGSTRHWSTIRTLLSRIHTRTPQLHSANQTHPETRLGRPAC